MGGLFWQLFRFMRLDILFPFQDTFEFALFRSHLIIAIIKTTNDTTKKAEIPTDMWRGYDDPEITVTQLIALMIS